MEAIIYVGNSVSDAEALRFYKENRGIHFPVEGEIIRFPQPTILVDEPKKMKQRGLDLLNRKR
jgi:hypothetical protein